MHDEDRALQQRLEGLKADFENLREEKVRTEQNLDNIAQQLGEMEKSAAEAWGTADVAELETLLADKRAENARLVEEYETHIREVKSALASVSDGEQGGEGEDGGAPA